MQNEMPKKLDKLYSIEKVQSIIEEDGVRRNSFLIGIKLAVPVDKVD